MKTRYGAPSARHQDRARRMALLENWRQPALSEPVEQASPLGSSPSSSSDDTVSSR
ncbi:hypothetical protein [Plasticicumulans acidivorans]|uniref:Uncharacterized protein n=1 Tax=Plasticicumulans acidivorans TaxID=886464 RepID=A0A317MQ90_9GAMM|nr:hypothetical protein [Plasticicumulans acidivorans]PWV58742.1 hypothetical protein C7443_11468 [Plasticicumulans acidivorans]